MNKKLFKFISWGTFAGMMILLAGCTPAKKEGQKIIVTAGKVNISVYSHRENFLSIMDSLSLDDLDYIKNNKNILMEFNGKIPKSIRLSEHILNEKGEPKFSTEEKGKDIDIKWNKNKASFKIGPNFATSFSSAGHDYNPGATIKGYRLVCDWGESNSEHFFVIRGDSAILNE